MKKIICLALVFAMLFSGVLYAWSILKVPFKTDFGWSDSTLAFNFTLTMCFFCLGAFFGSLICKKAGTKITLIISGLLVGAGFVSTGAVEVVSSVAAEAVSVGALLPCVLCGLSSVWLLFTIALQAHRLKQNATANNSDNRIDSFFIVDLHLIAFYFLDKVAVCHCFLPEVICFFHSLSCRLLVKASCGSSLQPFFILIFYALIYK